MPRVLHFSGYMYCSSQFVLATLRLESYWVQIDSGIRPYKGVEIWKSRLSFINGSDIHIHCNA